MRLSLADLDAPLTHLDVKRARKNELEQNYLQMFRLSVFAPYGGQEQQGGKVKHRPFQSFGQIKTSVTATPQTHQKRFVANVAKQQHTR